MKDNKQEDGLGEVLGSEPQDNMGRPRIELSELIFDGWDLLLSDIVFSTQEFCALKLGISSDTLSRRIQEKYGITFAELKKQKRQAVTVSIFQKQFEMAMEGNPTLLIWLGKQRGQTDKLESKVDNRNIKLEMSTEEKLEMAKMYAEKLMEEKE